MGSGLFFPVIQLLFLLFHECLLLQYVIYCQPGMPHLVSLSENFSLIFRAQSVKAFSTLSGKSVLCPTVPTVCLFSSCFLIFLHLLWQYKTQYSYLSGQGYRPLDSVRDGLSNFVQVTTRSLFPYLWCVCVCVCVCVCLLNCSVVSDSVTPWTVARQASLSLEFFRQEFCTGFPFHTPGNLPDPGIEFAFLASSALAGGYLFYHCLTNGNNNGANLVGIL